MYKPHDLGRKGEELALEILKNKGLTILDRNWRSGRTELDIIASDQKFLIICEVKARSTDYFGSPDEAVDARKINAIAEAGAAYQEEKNLDLEFRFDIINIIFKNDIAIHIDHLEGAFYP